MIEMATRLLRRQPKPASNKAADTKSKLPASDNGPVSIMRDTDREDSAIKSGSAFDKSSSGKSGRDEELLSGRKVRWLDRLSFKLRVQITLPLVAVAVAAAFVFLGLDSKQAGHHAQLSQLVGDALMHSQRLAKSTPGFIQGTPEAGKQLRESREALSQSISALGTFGGEDAMFGLGIPLAQGVNGKSMTTSWKTLDTAVQQLADQSGLVLTLAQLSSSMLAQNKNALEAAQVIAAHKVQSNASAREVSAAGDLVMLTQKLANDVARLSDVRSATDVAARTLDNDLQYFRDLLAAFGNGSERLRVAALTDAESKLALVELVAFERAIAPQMQKVLDGLKPLVLAKQSELAIFTESEVLRSQLSALQTAIRTAENSRSWNSMFALGCGLLALLAALSLVRGYTRESSKRAEAAEQQRRIAQGLEQDAKRTNDQNQAAILRLMNELQEVADGDLTVQATVSEDITGAIADSVNYTVEELRNLVARINSTAELVNDASSTAQMTASSLQAASDQQSREIRETGEAVLRMAQQINEVSARASESTHVARQSVKVSQEGGRAVQNAISGMNSIRDQIQDTAKRIKRLGESSQEVGEIVELISDITEQTNVLALNAAIQAASAGEAGRGFTIVAEEVQRLAERSGEATKQIAALIKTIQADTQDAVAAMERSTQGVVEGTRLSDDAGRALVDIARVSNQLGEMIEHFASSTSKQAASAGTVAQSIQRILLVTEQTSEGTLQTAGSIRQLAELAQELKRSAARFKVA